jgi:hypothetical protein
METTIEITAKKIMELPRSTLSVNNISKILEADYIKIKNKLKEQTMLLLMDCHNKKLSVTDAIVIINNWENGKQL